MMRDDFCVFILTHGRPDRVVTWDSLRKAGYTGKVYIVIDDEDKTAAQYRERFGDLVLQFSKSEIAKTFDEGDNFGDRRAIVYARNVCFDLAEQVGCRYFMELDDDYSGFYYRFDTEFRYCALPIRSIDDVIGSMIDFVGAVPVCSSLCMSQGGDHIGGGERKQLRMTRKAMNTFVCSTGKRFQFVGRINEDVNTYTSAARRGLLLFTINGYQCNQKATQSNSGGMTDLYLDSGTYVKSFYSVMYCPSSVRISTLNDPRSPHSRIHHKINWNATAPKILAESHRKA